MKIAKVIINHFRSIKKTIIDLNDINAIVGANNNGKSNFLKALNACFNFDHEKQFFIDEYHFYSSQSTPKIEIHFTDLEQQHGIDQKYIYKNKIIIKVSFEVKNGNCQQIVEYKNKNKSNKLTWYKDKEILQQIKNQLGFIIIPTGRDANSIEQTESNILQTILETMMERKTQSRDNYTVKFKEAIKNLKKALKEISSLLTKEIPIDSPVKIVFDYMKDITYKNFLSFMSIIIKESGQSHKLIECGSGIQSSVIMSLYNLLAKIKNKSIIIALEEPETHLHTQAQIELITSYKKMLENKDVSQFLFTTHSANIINNLDHTDIILCKKDYLANKNFNSDFKKVPIDFLKKHKLDDLKYNQFYQYKNSDFFFANHVVITESKNEIEMIKLICEKKSTYGSFNYQSNGISYLSLDGVLNIKYVICLLHELNIPYTLIVDKDFFVSYSHDEYKKSIDEKTGFPVYKKEYKKSNREMIKFFIPEEKKQTKVLQAITENAHKKVLDLLDPCNIICMQYSLDLDLILSNEAQEKFYKELKIKNKSITELTQNNKKAIKNIKNMITVFTSLSDKDWSMSYLKIKNRLSKINKNLNNKIQ